MTVYISKADLTNVKSKQGGLLYVYKDQAVDGSVCDPEHLKILVERGALVELEVPSEPEPEQAAEPTTKDKILAAVGDDAEKAQGFLDAELEKGDKARKTLVEGLQAVIAAAEGNGNS